jgi:hypothetical protein
MTDNISTEKDDGLYVVSRPGRAVSFLPDIPSLAIHTVTLIDGMHPFTEHCHLTGETRYCAGYTIVGARLLDRWLEAGCDDQVVWDELRRWLDSDEPLRQEFAEEEQHRRDVAAGHWR